MPGRTAPLQVLIVEDEAIIALLYQTELETLGPITTDITSTVSASLLHIDKRPPDLVLLDYNLGHETSAAIAHRLNALAIPYILCTAYPGLMICPVIFRPICLLSKPVEMTDLSRRIMPMLKDQSLERFSEVHP